MNTTHKPTTGFWIIAVIALLWNLMGIFQFISATFMLDAMVEALPEEQAVLYTGMPSWYFVVFGIATVTGLVASITMLMRKKITVPLFGISLLTVLIIQAYWLFATDVIDIMGPASIAMPLVVIVIFLYYYNKGAAQKGWLS